MMLCESLHAPTLGATQTQDKLVNRHNQTLRPESLQLQDGPAMSDEFEYPMQMSEEVTDTRRQRLETRHPNTRQNSSIFQRP